MNENGNDYSISRFSSRISLSDLHHQSLLVLRYLDLRVSLNELQSSYEKPDQSLYYTQMSLIGTYHFLELIHFTTAKDYALHQYSMQWLRVIKMTNLPTSNHQTQRTFHPTNGMGSNCLAQFR